MSKRPPPESMPGDPDRAPRRTRRGSGGVKLVDVARLAGVSPITVSRALNDPDTVSTALQARVQEAVERTGYVPNRLAGGLASSRSRLVAAVVPSIAGPVFMPTVQALIEALAAHGYQLMLGQGGYAPSREDALLQAIIGRRPDGIVLTGVMHSEQGRQRLRACGIPVVETWDLTATPVDMLVGFSHERVGEEVARYLHQRGCRQVGLLTGDDERAGRRARAFEQAAMRLGVTGGALPVITVPAPTTLGSGRRGLAALLERHPEIDGLFCSSDQLALGVLVEAAARRMAVPRQLAVVGFGDLEFAASTDPALTTVRVDGTAIGQQAARFIVERAAGRQIPEPIVDIGFSIVQRDSA